MRRLAVDGPQSLGGVELHTQRIGSTVYVEVGGELDARNSLPFELRAAEVICEPETAVLVLDGSGIVHIGSHGLAAIIEVSRLASSQAVGFEVQHPSRVLRRLLDLAGMTRLIKQG